MRCDSPTHYLKFHAIVKRVDRNIAKDGMEGCSIEELDMISETIAVAAVPLTTLESCVKPNFLD